MQKNENNGRSLHELSQELLEWLRLQSYSVDHMNKHRQVAKQVSKFMMANSIGKYTATVGNAFLEDYFSKRKSCANHRKRVEMIVYRLNDCIDGKMPELRRTNHTDRVSLTDQFAAILEKYLGWQKAHGSKASTIKAKSKYCGDFFLYLADLGCKSADDIAPEHICKTARRL